MKKERKVFGDVKLICRFRGQNTQSYSLKIITFMESPHKTWQPNDVCVGAVQLIVISPENNQKNQKQFYRIYSCAAFSQLLFHN